MLISYILFSSGSETLPVNAAITLEIQAPETPSSLTFAGENVPLNEYGIYEKFDNELISNAYFHSNTIKMMKRANRWFPIIEPILKENNIPEDFKYLALAESGLQNVTSPSGAKGFWQFLKKTAQQYGLEVNKDIDERYNVLLETQAACDYLQDAHQKLGNWTLAAAAYNAGMDKITKRLKEQKVSCYYDLALNTETSRYLFRILAIKTILENPQKYGFRLSPKDFYPPEKYTTIQIDTSINNLVDFARERHINYRILKNANPWMRSDKLPDKSRKVYSIKIPETK
jgi:hypothetical protein